MPENAGLKISGVFWDVTGIRPRGPSQDDAGAEAGRGFTRPVLLGIADEFCYHGGDVIRMIE